ncbi:hypothetical protein HOK51_07725 [Candidatus Woesearchaeota archaeon]|jgi:hypothetical protein|nr:hypothetical protein [Candidatus Woesearchaeota archaeon]MBT6519713.1 hypothetical protein [Candidatus Woesearchaeota archaeon]MBT7368093.1 hypothetical protein [Candidatus Woesearchaeota archaeon]
MNQAQTKQNTRARETSQPLQNSFALKKLQGIKPKGVKAKDNSNLENLLNIFDMNWSDFLKSRINLPRAHISTTECLDLKRETKTYYPQINYSESDLISFIFSKSRPEDAIYSEYVGMYTSALLEMLIESNKNEGKRTVLYLDGQGNDFPYLFYHLNDIDILILNNMSSFNLCYNFGFPGGKKINMLIGINIEDDQVFRNTKGGSSGGLLAGYNINGRRSFDVKEKSAEFDWIVGENVCGGNSLMLINKFACSFDELNYSAKQVMSLIKSIPKKSYDEVIKTALKIESIYKSILPKEE